MRSKFYVFIAYALLAGVAVVCAPRSCEWGNTVYFYSGFALLLALVGIPVFDRTLSISQKINGALLFPLILIAEWIMLFLLLNFRLMCRLF